MGTETGRSALAVEHAYNKIRDAIIRGKFGPHVRLGEEALAQRFGVSRTPVREAFRRLEMEGLVEIRPNVGVRVVEWSAQDLENAFEVRILLEARAAFRAATRIDDEQIEKMKALAEEVREQSERAPYEEKAVEQRCILNAQFHQIIMEVSGNDALQRTVEGITSFPLVKWNFRNLNVEERLRSDEQHLELLRAFEERDGEWAAAIMTSHVTQARSAMLRRLPPASSIE